MHPITRFEVIPSRHNGGVSFPVRQTTCGFSLIEVLVSMLVLAVGVIGSTGMQLAALRTTQQSTFQTTALQLASDIADTLRVGRLHSAETGEDGPLPQIDYNSADGADPDAPATLCYTSTCNVSALIEFEIYEWKKRVKSALPGGRVLVCYDSQPWDEAQKALRWDCNGGAGKDGPLVIKLGWQIKNPDGSLTRESDGSVPPSVALSIMPA